MKFKMLLLSLVLGMGLINQPINGFSINCDILKDTLFKNQTLICCGIAAASGLALIKVIRDFNRIQVEEQSAAKDQSDKIIGLYNEKIRLDVKYGWCGADFDSDIKSYFTENNHLVFENCIFFENHWITPVEFFLKQHEPELVNFLLQLKDVNNAIYSDELTLAGCRALAEMSDSELQEYCQSVGCDPEELRNRSRSVSCRS